MFVGRQRVLRRLLEQGHPFTFYGYTKRCMTNETNRPLETIKSATSALEIFSARLKDLQQTLEKDIVLPSGQTVTLKDIVIHSRDAEVSAFHRSAAKDARSMVLPTAESIESELKSLAKDYLSEVIPKMRKAAIICKDTPCGGASWEVNFDTDETQIRVEGKDTPCGRLQMASDLFVKTTFDTKEHVTLGSRAAIIMRVAMDLNAPLSDIRKTDGERRNKMYDAFAKDKVETPWLRSDEEYKNFLRYKKKATESVGGE